MADLIRAGHLYVGDGYRAKNSELAPEGLPFARAGNIQAGFRFEGCDRFPEADLARVGVKVSRPGDVVFTSKGSVGRFAFVREDTERFVYSPQLCFWRSLDSTVLLPRFLYYWVHSHEFQAQVDAVKSQTDMADYVSLRNQRSFSITVPPLSTQQSVVVALSPYDELIELSERRVALLREARELLLPRLLNGESAP